jgi:hypothetical protein
VGGKANPKLKSQVLTKVSIHLPVPQVSGFSGQVINLLGLPLPTTLVVTILKGHLLAHLYQNSIYLAKQFSGEDFLKWANQKQELLVVAMFGNGS